MVYADDMFSWTSIGHNQYFLNIFIRGALACNDRGIFWNRMRPLAPGRSSADAPRRRSADEPCAQFDR